MKTTLTVKQAIRRGLLVVNGPVLLLLVGPGALFAVLIEHHWLPRRYNALGLLLFIAGFVLAWLWWSFAVPRWRLWAYQRVGAEQIPALKAEAVAVGLTWPAGHRFERTEIKSSRQRRRERELDPPTSPEC